ncbi:hypothetical protein MPNT_400009 [Candidatus Methylacidithermus pantelleriae]|uniref:Uncharacterized protein n=1 Tax=Candidatus Methylacidithermus pantelleriae TaxID=2744239 RepID=A0A8J2BNE9_9BACT|nr:hypothetical protein MPNT_400009 [Candidatus Methylacidithermus pantelleriae]
MHVTLAWLRYDRFPRDLYELKVQAEQIASSGIVELSRAGQKRKYGILDRSRMTAPDCRRPRASCFSHGELDHLRGVPNS